MASGAQEHGYVLLATRPMDPAVSSPSAADLLNNPGLSGELSVRLTDLRRLDGRSRCQAFKARAQGSEEGSEGETAQAGGNNSVMQQRGQDTAVSQIPSLYIQLVYDRLFKVRLERPEKTQNSVRNIHKPPSS